MVEKITNEFSSNDTFICIVHYNKLRDNFFLDFFSFLHFRFRRTDACQQQILIKNLVKMHHTCAYAAMISQIN